MCLCFQFNMELALMDELSIKMRTYLAEIYRLADREQPEDGFVTTSALADMLMVSPPAVNRMVNRLERIDNCWSMSLIRALNSQNRVSKKHYNNSVLIVSQRHFYLRVMGFDWDSIYQEASQISSALSDVLIDRMAAMSGNPQFCPHGEPIPQE